MRIHGRPSHEYAVSWRNDPVASREGLWKIRLSMLGGISTLKGMMRKDSSHSTSKPKSSWNLVELRPRFFWSKLKEFCSNMRTATAPKICKKGEWLQRDLEFFLVDEGVGHVNLVYILIYLNIYLQDKGWTSKIHCSWKRFVIRRLRRNLYKIRNLGTRLKDPHPAYLQSSLSLHKLQDKYH